MASTHSSVRHALTGRRILLTLVAAGGVVLAPLPALAAPEQTATTSQEAAALVASRAHDLEVVTEKFNDARVQLDATQAAAAQAGAEAEAAAATVAAARDQVRQVARSAYTGESLSTLQAMLSSSSADEMLDRVGTLDTIAGHNNDLLSAAQQATEQAAAAKAAAEKAAADAQAQVDQVSAQQDDLNAQIADYQAQYDRLNAAEQQASRAQAERHAAPAPSAAPSDGAGSDTGTVAAGSVVAGSGAAQIALDTALAQLGDPYVWAASGPNSFDCSGLTQYAYAAAGISLPHSSSAQSQMGAPVSRGALQPGDLVFFYSPVSHVGIYIGNGQMVHASTSGEPVKIGSLDSMGSYNSARRLAG
jgi:cell wall-associated NlpC family hydrolase